jgi:hypothetical protein
LPMCPDSPRGSRSGSLVLPRPLLGLRRRRLALEVFRELRAADVPKNFDAWPPWPSLPFRAPVPPGPDGFRPSSRGIRPASASLRAPLGSPSIGMATGVHSRTTLRPRFGVEGATLAACSALVVSHHLGGFLLRKFAGLLRPAANPGVRRVSSAARLGSSRSEDLSPSRPSLSPRRSFVPFEGCPRLWAVPRHRGRYLQVGSVALPRRCRRCCAPSFLGWFPFKVLRAPFHPRWHAEAWSRLGIPPGVRVAGGPKPVVAALPESVRS